MFEATTNYSDKFKSLFEILFQLSTSTVKLHVDSNGIKCFDESDVFSFIYVGNKTCFDTYTFTYDGPIIIGLGQHVNSQLKDVKSKCRLTITISGEGSDSCPYEFSIKAVRLCGKSTQDKHRAVGNGCSNAGSSTKNLSTNLSANVTYVGGYDVTLKLLAERLYVTNYDVYEILHRFNSVEVVNYTSMLPCDFVQLCKSFKTNNYVVDVQKEFSQLHFITNVAGISEIKKTFGEFNKNDYELVRHTFKVDQMSKLVKLASFARTIIKIQFTLNGIRIVIDDGELGQIDVHANKYVEM